MTGFSSYLLGVKKGNLVTLRVCILKRFHSRSFRSTFKSKKKNVKPWNRLAHSCRSLSRFLSQEATSSISTSMDGMPVHHRSLPRNFLGFPDNSLVLIYTPGGERYCESKLSCSRTQHSVPDQDRSIISRDERTDHESTAPPP